MELAPEPTLRTPPLVLLLGNHSSGKSSLINHLLNHKVQRTGVAPTDDGFTVLIHGDEPRTLDGQAMISHPEMPFGTLGQFGPGLVEHVEGRVLNADLLRHVRLIDSPGMIDASDGESKRPYDFTAVIRWFAEHADLILLFFDPEKPGTTGETISVLNESLGGIDHKMRIVMNKMDLFDGIRDFARTYGALCWNLSRCLQTKDLPHIYTTVIPEMVREDCKLQLDGFAAALLELEKYIADLPARRTDAVLSRVIEEARILHLRATVTERLRGKVVAIFAKSLLACAFVTALSGVLTWWYFYQENYSGGIIGVLATATLLAITGWLPGVLRRWRETRGHNELDALFRDCFKERLAQRDRALDLEHDWSRARPGLLRMLSTVGLKGLKHTSRRQLRKLESALATDLPQLRRN